MTRDQAIDRVRKLQAVTVARGATAHEAAAARDRAARLVEWFGLGAPPPAPEALQGYAAAARMDRRSSRSLRFVAFG
ncbi:MAG TPA: DUF2786 domain-containing protein [Solirubrobacteraceae bacterium]|nr:DUF2786 domain-containing protein [Solirubrobacteraceae bacterium]